MLRSSISNTRKFFQKTLENFKSFFSNGYQKLPKNPNACNLTFYNLHNHKHQSNPKSSPSSLQKQFHAKPGNPVVTHSKNTTTHQRKADEDATKGQTVRRRRERTRLPVAEKLREIENLMGINNSEDHVSDVQEFLHYYSRLNCSVYIDIVEQFFMEMYAEFFEPLPRQIEPPRNAVSSRRRRVVGT